MILKSEIKDFVKKVLILGILLSLLINLFVTYISGINGSTFAESNDTKFVRSDSRFIGTTGVAVSLNVGSRFKEAKEVPVNIFTDVMPISFILANKKTARDKIIISNMINLSEYLNILRTDVNKLLDQSTDRESMLQSFQDQLELRYTNTSSEIRTLQQQGTELQSTLTNSTAKIDKLKTDLTLAYKAMDYDKTQESLDNYLKEKDSNTYSNTYLIFISKFIASYTILNNYNKVLLDTIINNKEALVKDVTVVLPDSSTALMKQLKLLNTEAEFKSRAVPQ
ncbi:MAG: hypothetical protein PHS92_00405 [Candidatus Gracilibacteria bacterium]|nr:hypothetical protein [Candidatus Gracilibacteria bacterium]